MVPNIEQEYILILHTGLYIESIILLWFNHQRKRYSIAWGFIHRLGFKGLKFVVIKWLQVSGRKYGSGLRVQEFGF